MQKISATVWTPVLNTGMGECTYDKVYVLTEVGDPLSSLASH